MYFTHDFQASIETFGVGKSRKVWYRVLFLPPELESQLPFDKHPRLRVDAEIADVPVNGAWIPAGDGRRYIIVSPKVLKAAGLNVGDVVEMRFRIADQDHVDVPAALQAAIDTQSDIGKLWSEITPGKRRALAYYVSSAKAEATIEKRLAEVYEALRERNGQIRK